MNDKPKQTTLDRRDKRRATALVRMASRATAGPLIHPDRLAEHIAAALKKERQDTGMAAIQWFLFSDRKERQKVKRVIQIEGRKR